MAIPEQSEQIERYIKLITCPNPKRPNLKPVAWARNPCRIEDPPFTIHFMDLDSFPDIKSVLADGIRVKIESINTPIDAVVGMYPYGSRFAEEVSYAMNLPLIVAMKFGDSKGSYRFVRFGESDRPIRKVALIDDFFTVGGDARRCIRRLHERAERIEVPVITPVIAAQFDFVQRDLAAQGTRLEPLIWYNQLINSQTFIDKCPDYMLLVNAQNWQARAEEYHGGHPA